MTSFAALSTDDRQCDPRFCALTNRLHKHCACGLPMRSDGTICSLCRREGVDPLCADPAAPLDGLAWDGCSYPSRRLRRQVLLEPEPYEHLLQAVLGSTATDSIRLPDLLAPEAVSIARSLAGHHGEEILIVSNAPSLPKGEDCGAGHNKQRRRNRNRIRSSSLGARSLSSPHLSPGQRQRGR